MKNLKKLSTPELSDEYNTLLEVLSLRLRGEKHIIDSCGNISEGYNQHAVENLFKSKSDKTTKRFRGIIAELSLRKSS